MEVQTGSRSSAQRQATIGVAILQSLLLLLLHEGIQAEAGWLMEPLWRFPAYAMIVGAPLAIMLSIGELPIRRTALLGTGFAVVLVLTGLYCGYQSDGGEHARWAGAPAYIMLAIIGSFVALPPAQVLAEGGSPRLPYPRLYFRAWNNALLLGLTVAFIGLFWLILALWAALFQLIEIGFFSALFFERRFAYPVTGLVGGFGLTLFSDMERVVAVKRRVLIAITRGLVPLLALITVLFLGFLTLTGIAPLWNAASAATLLLFLTAAQILFTGATYDDGEAAPPYPRGLRWFVHAALVLTPVYPLLAIWAIGLRVGQYGWSTDRIYAVAVAVVLALYSVGYAISVYRRSADRWLPWIGRCNTTMAGVVVTTCILLASPLIDARSISVSDQVDRLLQGETSSSDFDYKYLRFEGGRAGNAALERLAELQQHPEAAAIRTAAGKTLQLTHRWARTEPTIDSVETLREWVVLSQDEKEVPETFWQFLLEQKDNYPTSQWCFRDVSQPCLLVAVDMNEDRHPEYVLLHPGPGCQHGLLFAQHEHGDAADSPGRWHQAGRLAPEAGCSGNGKHTAEEIRALLLAGEYDTLPSRWRRLRIGDRILTVEN